MEEFRLEDGWNTDPECTYPKRKLGWNNNNKKKMSDKLRSRIKYYNGQKYKNNLQGNDTKILTIRIDTTKIDEIVGKKRKNIKILQKISNTTIKIQKSAPNSPNTILKIFGTYSALSDAEQMIENMLKQISLCDETTNNHWQDIDTKCRLKSKSSIIGYKHNSIVNYFPFITIPIDVNIVGRFIGKEGKNIHQLQDESNTIIRVKTVNPDNPHAIIIITGTPRSLFNAKILIKEFLKRLSIYAGANYWSLVLTECGIEDPLFKYPPIIKNLYREDPVVANMSPKYVTMIRKANNIIEVKCMGTLYAEYDINDVPIPNPILTFEQAFSNYPTMLKKIREQGLEKPNSIECQAWPILLSGKDMLGIAPTITNKTLAFLLPALIHISKQNSFCNSNGPNVLILVASKMQALKIQKEVDKYSYFGIKAVSVYYGGNRNQEIKALKENVEILIATSQRLNVLVNMNVVKLKYVTYVVLNEIDRMLKAKLASHIKKSLSYIRLDSQLVMISTIFSKDVKHFAQIYMENPIEVFVKSVLHNIRHEVQYVSNETTKFSALLQFIHEMNPKEKIIVFTKKISQIDQLECDFIRTDIDPKSILSLKYIRDRKNAQLKIEEKTTRIIITTDFLIRELDVNIAYVYNYDLTFKFKNYIHRSKYARCDDKTGVNIMLMTKKHLCYANRLIKLLTNFNQEVPKNLYAIAEAYQTQKKEKEKMKKERKCNYKVKVDASWMELEKILPE